MPLSKFLLRNEYCLGDPKLYKVADKNDPEAVLEGVSMAGLVGVLRQLGDLAEFAAGIFNDLHEDVIATASRGHELKIRVQQLEAEFPFVEKAFFSQTDHSLFLYNDGIDWHPSSSRDNQNLIAQGELPRSVMDSYEECRGPPRLFLLDRFDTGGAGTCLKRYSDPSVFKAAFSSSESPKAEFHNEMKRKARRKGSNWKTREPPEEFAKTHAKSHQLFEEELNQASINVPLNRLKLKKRQLDGFLFDTINGQSYMERFLEAHSAMHDDVGHEVELCTRSPDNQLPMRKEKILEMCKDDIGEDIIKETTLKELTVRTSNFYKVDDKKEEIGFGISRTEGKADGYRSDDVTSEIDTYLDALATLESEIETDSECRLTNKRTFFHIEKKMMGSSSSEEQELQNRFSDSHSVGNSSASDERSNSLRRGRSSFSYSDSPSSSVKNVLLDDDVAAKLDPFTGFVDISSAKLATSCSGNLNSNDNFREASEIPSYRSAFGAVSCDSPLSDSTSTHSGKFAKESPNADSLGSSSNPEDDDNISSDLPCRGVSDFPSQSGDCSSSAMSMEVQSTGVLDIGLPSESSDYFLHRPTFPKLNIEQRDNNDVIVEMPLKECEEGNCSHEDLINGNLDYSLSVGLASEKQFNDLAEQNPGNNFNAISSSGCSLGSPKGSEVDDVKCVYQNAYLPVVEGNSRTGGSVDLGGLDITNEASPSEFVSTTVDVTCLDIGGFAVSPTPHQEPETEAYLELADTSFYEMRSPRPSCSGSDSQEAVMDPERLPLSDSKPLLSNPESKSSPGLAPNFVHSLMVVENQTHLHLNDAEDGENERESQLGLSRTDVSTSVENAKSSSAHSLLEPGAPLREALELEDNRPIEESLLADEEDTKLFIPESDTLQLPSTVTCNDHFLDGSLGYLSSEHLRQLPESYFLEVLASQRVGCSEPSGSSLQYFPSFDLLHGATHQQLSEPKSTRLVLDTPLPDLEANLMEIPPFPPLPPIEWRIGKTRQRSLVSEKDMAPSSLNPCSVLTTGEQGQCGFAELAGEFEQPLNPFLVKDEKLLNRVEDRELVNSSPNPLPLPRTMVGDEKSTQDFHTLEAKLEQSLSPALSPPTDNEKSPSCSLDSERNLVLPFSNGVIPPSNLDVEAQCSSLYLDGEVVQPSNLFEKPQDTNELASLPTNGVMNSQQSSVDLEEEMEQPLNSLQFIQDREDEKLGDTLLNSEEEKDYHPYHFKPSSTMEKENPHWTLENEITRHVTLSLEEGMMWQPKLYVMPPFEEEKPKANLKAWLHRPRDPLIQAVASHDKSTLRKVSELVQPQVEPKVDERDSLLQQIRAQSFNLKPTVATRPNTQAVKSNLRVTAILEKAQAIRQALAGSDEDDSESWSDS